MKTIGKKLGVGPICAPKPIVSYFYFLLGLGDSGRYGFTKHMIMNTHTKFEGVLADARLAVAL
eukprot:2927963-Amphidinium_carterae.1